MFCSDPLGTLRKKCIRNTQNTKFGSILKYLVYQMLHAWLVKFLEDQQEHDAARTVPPDTSVAWGFMTNVLQRGDACDTEVISERDLDMTCVDVEGECDESLRAAVNEEHSRHSTRTTVSYGMWEGESEQLQCWLGECLQAPVDGHLGDDEQWDTQGARQPLEAQWRLAVPAAPSATISASESVCVHVSDSDLRCPVERGENRKEKFFLL